MNTNETDREFRQLFVELKRRDAQRTPAFAMPTQAKPPVHGAIARICLVPASLAMIALGVFFAWRQVQSVKVDDDSETWASFSTWETPSDVLLASVHSMPAPDSETQPNVK